jgi:hypothetical protein
MHSVEDRVKREKERLFQEIESIEFVSTPCNLLTEAIRAYESNRPREITLNDTYIGQQAILWAYLGPRIIGAEV